jgi:hypothetical protein
MMPANTTLLIAIAFLSQPVLKIVQGNVGTPNIQDLTKEAQPSSGWEVMLEESGGMGR